MIEAEHRHEGAATMIDSKGQKTTLTLEPEQVAIVPGLEPSRSVASILPVQRPTLCWTTINPTFHFFLAPAFLVRLDQDEDFASDLAEWDQEKLHGEAGRSAAGK